MAVKTTGTRKYLIWGSILVLAGVGGYLVYKRLKTKKAKDDCSKNGGTWDEVTKTCILPTKVDVNTNGSTNNSTNNSGNTNSGTVNPFKSKEEVKTFQKWVINNKNDKAILGTSADDGNWGPDTGKAWDKYGVEYLAAITQTNKVKVDYIYSWLQKFYNSEAFSKSNTTINYIQSLPAGLIDGWYLHCKNTVSISDNIKKWTFVYNNQTYDTLTGKMILNYNPLVTNFRINKGAYVFEDAWDGDKFIKSPSEGAIGKPTLVQYQQNKNIVWCYFPNLGFGGDYKYIATTNLIKA